MLVKQQFNVILGVLKTMYNCDGIDLSIDVGWMESSYPTNCKHGVIMAEELMAVLCSLGESMGMTMPVDLDMEKFVKIPYLV